MNDLRQTSGIIPGAIYMCILEDELKRITSSSFTVSIPYLMAGNTNDEKITIDRNLILNENKEIKTEIPTFNKMVAKSLLQYHARLDGWIPEFKIDSLSAEEATLGSATIGGPSGETELAGEGPHKHGIAKNIGTSSISAPTISYSNGVSTGNREVDYHDINKIYIKKGHKLLCTFPIGGGIQDIVIVGIYDVTVFYNETTDSTGTDNIIGSI